MRINGVFYRSAITKSMSLLLLSCSINLCGMAQQSDSLALAEQGLHLERHLGENNTTWLWAGDAPASPARVRKSMYGDHSFGTSISNNKLAGTALSVMDSISVLKIEYEYVRTSANDTLTQQEALFANMATYGGATVYYTESAYRLQYADDYWEIGNFNEPHRYTIYQNVASERLSAAQQMPDMYDLPGVEFPVFLWAKDYDMRDGGAGVDIMGMPCNILVFDPQNETVDAVYETYVSADIPKIPWYPYTFISRLPTGFLGLYKTNAPRSEIEGIEAKEVSQVNVPVGFFEVPEVMEIEHMLAPPALK